MPSFRQLENPEYYLAAEVFSEDGVLLGKISIENLTWTEYEELSPYLVDALIATEDIRYSRHSGIDIRGLGRAAIRTILLGQNTGGGSTITQQLAKQLYPRDTTRTSAFVKKIKLGVSKFKEWQTAVKLERSYTKEEIITMYLNKFNFSYNAIGIRSAAKVYFNTTPDSLNLEQSAVLIGMLKASTKYNPVRNVDLMLQRRNVVISQMAKYGYLTPAVADSVKKLPIKVDFRVEDHNTGPGHLSQTISDKYNEESLNPRRAYTEMNLHMRMHYGNGKTIRFMAGAIRTGNLMVPAMIFIKTDLKIYTTINSRMQRYAEEALAEHLSKEVQPDFYKRAKKFKNPPYSNDLTRREVDELMASSVERTERYYFNAPCRNFGRFNNACFQYSC